MGAPTSAKCDTGVVFLLSSELNTERSHCYTFASWQSEQTLLFWNDTMV